MKKLFEPMMYPWTAMMDYFGYGDDYDYDYDYDSSYGQYARSFASRASDYVPWDSINEVRIKLKDIFHVPFLSILKVQIYVWD